MAGDLPSRRRTTNAYTSAIGKPSRNGATTACAVTHVVRRYPLHSQSSGGRSDASVAPHSGAPMSTSEHERAGERGVAEVEQLERGQEDHDERGTDDGVGRSRGHPAPR